jgi:transcriptional regulator with XRE-family HTH domain
MGMAIALGTTLRELRVDRLQLTQRELAEKLRISVVHLSNIETGTANPSRDLVDRFRDLCGVDLYILTWCRHGDLQKLPAPVRKAAQALADAMEEELTGLTGAV